MEWLDEACEIPLDSVLCIIRLLISAWFARKRRLSLGISKGRSPKSTDVALPEVQASLKKKKTI